MSTSPHTSISWYVQTAGVRPKHGYEWMSIDASINPEAAVSVVYGNLAGRRLVDLTSDHVPSIVLGRTKDGGFAFFANRLQPPGAPAKGDYQNRPITASLLGVAPPLCDRESLRVLLDAVAAAIAGTLAESLPVSWSAGEPVIDQDVQSWSPPAQDLTIADRPTTDQPTVESSTGLPLSDTVSATEMLAGLTVDDLARFPRDRLVVVRTDMLSRDDLAKLRPWLAISPSLKGVVTFPDRKSGFLPLLPLSLILAFAGLGFLVVITWIIVRRYGHG